MTRITSGGNETRNERKYDCSQETKSYEENRLSMTRQDQRHWNEWMTRITSEDNETEWKIVRITARDNET